MKALRIVEAAVGLVFLVSFAMWAIGQPAWWTTYTPTTMETTSVGLGPLAVLAGGGLLVLVAIEGGMCLRRRRTVVPVASRS